MKYREPKSNEVIDIPDDLIKTDREAQVLKYDILIFDEEDKFTWELVALRMNEELGTEETASAVRHVKDRITTRVRKGALITEINRNLERDIPFIDRDVTVEDKREYFAKRLLETSYTSTFVPSKYDKKRRILVVSDYHGTLHPFIERSLNTEQYDVCIHAGDILDQWEMHSSRLEGKTLTMQEKATLLDEEITQMRAWFEILDQYSGAQHIVIAGNHDVRVEAAFVRLLDPIIRNESLLVRMFRTPLQLLVEGLKNFELANQPLQWVYPDTTSEWAANSKFLYRLGDAIISHKNFTGRQPGTAVAKLWQWIQDYRHVLDLSDIRLALQAHTHSLMLDKNCQGGHVYLVETGCALKATALGYGLTYQGNWTPSAVGYTTFEQYQENDDWKTDLASVEIHGVN